MNKNCIEIRFGDKKEDYFIYCAPDYKDVDFSLKNDITPILIALKEILYAFFDKHIVDFCISMPDELKKYIIVKEQ